MANVDMNVETTSKSDESLADLTRYNEVGISTTAVKLQNDLVKLKTEIVKAKAKLTASQRGSGEDETLYGPGSQVDSQELNKLTQERTQTFLNFNSLQVALKAANSNQMLTKALNLDKESNISLEKEEEDYVRSLLEEQKELTISIFRSQEVGVQQELKVIKARTELANLYIQYQQLVGQAISGRKSKDGESGGIEVKNLQKQLQEGDYKINQLRFVIQKLMISHENLGLLFDDEKNARFKALFLLCGLHPEQLRQQIMEDDESVRADVAPAAAADLSNA